MGSASLLASTARHLERRSLRGLAPGWFAGRKGALQANARFPRLCEGKGLARSMR
jgi:hypothetical protein